MADAARSVSRLALRSSSSLCLRLVMSRNTAQMRSPPMRVERHRQRHEPVVAGARRDVEHVIEGAGAAQHAVEIIARRAFALGRQQIAERAAAKLGCRRAEQRCGAGIGADDAAFGIERDDAVGRRVEDRFEFAVLVLGCGQRTIGLPRHRADVVLCDVVAGVVVAGVMAVGQDQRQRRRAVPRHREHAAVDRQPVAALRHDRQRFVQRWSGAAGLGEGIGGRLGKQACSGRRPPRSRRGLRSRSIRESDGWRRAACHAGRPERRSGCGRAALAQSPAPRRVQPRGFEGFGRQSLRRRSARLRRRLFRTAQPRRQFLRQFAKRPALDRAQSRRHFGFWRRLTGETARHWRKPARAPSVGPLRRAASASAAARLWSATAAGIAGAAGVARFLLLRRLPAPA